MGGAEPELGKFGGKSIGRGVGSSGGGGGGPFMEQADPGDGHLCWVLGLALLSRSWGWAYGGKTSFLTTKGRSQWMRCDVVCCYKGQRGK